MKKREVDLVIVVNMSLTGFDATTLNTLWADKNLSILEDVVFEAELVKQIEVNIDYILMLAEKYHESHCKDQEILAAIEKAINSSLELRSKKSLIERFLVTINADTDIKSDWQQFVREQREKELDELIEAKKLKLEETKRFMRNAFRDGEVQVSGTEISDVMPPISRFAKIRDQKKQLITQKLQGLFEKYFGLVEAENGL